jgi:hypothetical protein
MWVMPVIQIPQISCADFRKGCYLLYKDPPFLMKVLSKILPFVLMKEL